MKKSNLNISNDISIWGTTLPADIIFTDWG